MKKKHLIIIFLITISACSQERKKNAYKIKDLTAQCSKIGNELITKYSNTELSEWYEGEKSDSLKIELARFETLIDKNAIDPTFHLQLMRQKYPFYSFHFYDKKTLKEFGQIFVVYKDKTNTFVDKINIITEKQLDKYNKETSLEEIENNTLPSAPPKF